MRTRFLNIDYFSPTPRKTLESLTFPNLPVPHIHPPSLSILPDLIPCLSPLNVSLQIPGLPVDSALSKFYSSVLPIHTKNAKIGDVDATVPSRSGKTCFDENRLLQQEAEVLHEEKELERPNTFGSEALGSELPTKDNGIAVDYKDRNRYDVIQFETPEMDIFLENACIFEKVDIEILSGVPEIENNLELLRQELRMQNPYEVARLIYSVEDVTSEYHMEQKAYVLEEDGSLHDQMCFHRSMFPSLEVDETTLGTLTCLSIEKELLLVLENTEPQHWLQKDNLVTIVEDLFGSREHEILQVLSDHCPLKQCPELGLLDTSAEMDIISIVESSQIQENSSPSPVVFQEFHFFDVNLSQLFESFFSMQTADEPDKCDCMFSEDMNFKNLNELVVTNELALVDDTFKSLPIPLFSDHVKIRSLCSIVEETLEGLDPQPLSASDEIYLDWHLLEENKCNSRIYSTYQSMLEEVDSHSIEFDMGSFDNAKVVFDFVFSDNVLNVPNGEEMKESHEFLSHEISMPSGHIVEGVSNKLLDDESTQSGNVGHLAAKDADRASLLIKSMSQFNDLDFFLNPGQANAGGYSDLASKAVDADATFLKVPSNNSRAACASNGVQLQSCDIVLYRVKLSDTIVAIIDSLEKSYLSIFRNERELLKTHIPFLAADSSKLLSLPKQKLMDCIKKISTQGTTSDIDESMMAFVTLCALKQMAWYMCFYGIHPVHLYLDKLCQSFECFKSRLDVILSLIEDARRKVHREITSSHPSLKSIQEILQSNTTQSYLKVLIVAEEIFWWSLKSLLISLGISFGKFKDYYAHANQSDLSKTYSDNTKMNVLPVPDCLLVSHEHVSASFPFNKFSIILEYGGSYGSSRVYSLSPKLLGTPLHFLKVELDESSVSKALCEGVDMPRTTGMTTENDEHMIIQKLEKLLNFLPIGDKPNTGYSGAADEAEVCSMPLPVPTASVSMRSENISQSLVSSPETVIIVNTQDFDKQMIVSRRSTYQRILAMEKEGAQVVERDSDLPVDVIFSSAICLVWYDCRNIGKKATAVDEASSCLPLCVENIATNVLTLLSFTFSGCILFFQVFEGEISFLSTIMESSDELYAAAASLGIDLQLFCSYSSELTDEIILRCISSATKLTRVLYPQMPESETLAESFLTKFPSINPLTAHSILSSGGALIEFLEWSHERRIRAMQKYHVSEESITLFSALCKYGEREDSKSIMTDCSSVSSGPDSGRRHFNVDSGTKRRKYNGSPQKIDLHIDEVVHFESLNQFTDDAFDPYTVSKPHNAWMSKDPEIFDEFRKPSLPPNGFLGQKQGSDMGTMIDHFTVTKPCDCQFSKSPGMSDEIPKPYSSSLDMMFGQNQGSGSAMTNNLDWLGIKKSNNLNDDIIGEVIDLTDSPATGQEFSSIGTPIKFSHSTPEMRNDSTRTSKSARKLSFSNGCHTPCSMAAEINSNSDIWSFKKDQRQTLPEVASDYLNTDFKMDISPVKHHMELSEKGLMQRSTGNSRGLYFQESEMTSYGGTPLSNALSSNHLQGNSPWTIEFLDRVREKSRLRQQSLSCYASSPCSGYSGNISKVSKRRSPSILESFKYQGGGTTAPEKKSRKKSVKSLSSSKNGKPPSSLLPIRTPPDKRARQTLSFAMNGGGGQSKLVWTAGTNGMSKKFRNHI